MEFSGGNGAALMQTWITEEFAYISSKRNLGISDLKEERHIRQRLQLPEFNGRNCEDWVSEMEDIFHFFHLSEEAKLKAAILSLDGGAQWWFEWEHRRRPFYEWQELKGVVARLFGPSSQVVHSDLTRLGYQVRHYGYPMSFSGGSDGIEDGGARLSTFASRDNVAGTQLGSGLDGLPQLSGSGGGPGNSGGGIGSGQGCLVKDGFRGDHGYGGAGYFDSSADERKWVRISGGEDDWVVGGSPNGGPGEGVGMVVIGGAGGSGDGPGSGGGPGVTAGREEGMGKADAGGGWSGVDLAKGGSDASGPGGGPGYFSGKKSGGGRGTLAGGCSGLGEISGEEVSVTEVLSCRQWSFEGEFQKIQEREVGGGAYERRNLENNLEVASKGKVGNHFKSDIMKGVCLLESRGLNQIKNDSEITNSTSKLGDTLPVSPTKLNEKREQNGPSSSEPNLSIGDEESFRLVQTRPNYYAQILQADYPKPQLTYWANPSSKDPIHSFKQNPPNFHISSKPKARGPLCDTSRPMRQTPINPHFSTLHLSKSPILKPKLPTQYSNPQTHPSKPMSNFTHSIRNYPTQFLQPTLPTPHSTQQNNLLYHQPNQLPKPNCTYNFPILQNRSMSTHPHSITASSQAQFSITVLLEEVRGISNEELARQWKPGIKHDNDHHSKGREVSANYFPP